MDDNGNPLLCIDCALPLPLVAPHMMQRWTNDR
jgi:hypothetical protein